MAEASRTPFPSASNSGASTAANQASAKIADAASAAHGAVDQAAAKAAPVIEKGARAAHQAIDSVAASAAPAVDWVKEKARIAQEAQEKFVASSSELISAKPLTAVVVALGIGYLLGRIAGSGR